MMRSDPNPAGLCFEHRLVLQDDVGRAFQQFVWEALSLTEFAGTGLVQHPVRGRDGGIDLYEEHSGKRTVIECKYHAETRSDSAESDWRKIATVLKGTLPDLCGRDEGGIATSPHAPWLDRDRPITSYWFCISTTLQNQAAIDRLRDEIRKDLAAVAKLHLRLDHLARIAVEVRSGQHFVGVLATHPTLRHRWFGGLPTGLAAVGTFVATTVRTFRKFLDSASLPYFSVGEFAEGEGVPAGSLRLDPGTLLAELVAGPRQALLLSGPGGVGKTRLALEIARSAERDAMIVLSCAATANEHAVTELLRSFSRPVTVLLFIDYAEAQHQLGSIAAAVEAANTLGHCVRIVATCRASTVSTVQQDLEDLGVRRLMLAGPESETYSSLYLDWVVGRILAYGAIEDVPGLAALCHRLPVLAAFALYLHSERQETFSRLFIDLAANTTFEEWAHKRIRLTLDRFRADRKFALQRIAEIAAVLPLPPAQAARLRATGDDISTLIEALISDGWFDDEEGTLVAAHDVFADALLTAYVFQPGIQSQRRAIQILQMAQTIESLGRALSAVDRLASHPRFQELAGPAIMRAMREHGTQALALSVQSILRSRLFSSADLVELIAEDDALARILVEDPALHGQLSYLAERLARSNDAALRGRGAAVLKPILEIIVDNHVQPTNLVLRRAYALDPQSFKDRALAEMNRLPTSHETHYLIVAWLKQGHTVDDVKHALERWLQAHASSNSKASFLFRSWFDAGGNIEAISHYIMVWLRRHAEAPEARFVYRAWLGTGGSVAAVEADILRWLTRYAEVLEAAYVYDAWLDAGGSVAAVEDDIRRWLTRHAEIPEAAYVYDAWLDAGGDGAAVEDDIRRWLTRHAEIREAGYVYDAWLDAGGGVAAVEPDIRRWLTRHAEIPEAQFVYHAWLSAGGGVATVEDDIRRWLDHHAEVLEARFVYRAWLDAGGGVAAVEDDIRRWLTRHRDRNDIDHVMRAWIDAGGSFEVVRTFAFDWLRCNLRSSEPLYILKHIVRQPNLPRKVVADAAVWCSLNVENPECITRIQRLLRYAKGDAERPLTDIALDVLERLEPLDLADRAIQVGVVSTITKLYNIFRTAFDNYDTSILRLRAIHSSFVKDGVLYPLRNEPKFVRSAPIAYHFIKLLESRAINFKEDRENIDKFFQWLETWSPDEKKHITHIVSNLARRLSEPVLLQRLGIAD